MERFCAPYYKEHEEAATNFYIKCEYVFWYFKWCLDGELYFWSDVRDAFMKQKHRMLFERDIGPIGSAKKLDKSGDKEADNTVSFLRRFHGHFNLPKELRF